MIPLRDTTPSKNVPVVNNLLIGVNVVLFLVELSQGGAMNAFVYRYGLVPGRYTIPGFGGHFTLFEQLAAWVSFMFLHGGWLHLLGNMWTLYIFGDNVEDRLGPLRYLIFYLLCGFTSGLSHFVLNAHSTAPVIGASGAVAGVMGAYFLLYPTSKILTLVPIIIIPLFLEIPAVVFLGIWFLLQFINAAGSHGAAGGIAWWAHVGGFVAGMVYLKLFKALPATGVSSPLRKATARRKTHRFQVARPGAADLPAGRTKGRAGDLYATITISPYEALVGTRKLITIPMGFQRRMYRVNVPPGVSTGKTLRLKGQGRVSPEGQRGDLMLKVIVK
jgi:membrane associated rhomboid family serine protease